MNKEANTGAWREALDCVDTLLSRPEANREQFLSDLEVSKPDLYGRVRALLNAERQAAYAKFLEVPSAKEPASAALKPNVKLGPYRIVRELGRGGMGEVWLARRDDGLYQGEVAIKTLHPYFAAGALRDRFLREANLLGRLTHPNIARLLDAGVTDGVVYLVLEYVRGQAIDYWCDERKIDVDGRVKLFADVCAAVAHAHANLIVHRDIKPSNILVTDEGQVKLLDFGIGKLVESEAQQENTELTRLTGRIFTPEYAAPEQILGQTITTATDVYSLGVLLHMLLSGTRPYASAENEIDLQRAVLHDDPIAMSRAVSALGEDAIATMRSTTLARLQRKLSGDLNHMVARALRKKPQERYQSVLELIADVERYQRHQPVEARAGSGLYRFGRFIRRHRAGALAAAVSIAALIIGTGVALWQAGNARQQAKLATIEAGKATAVKNFLLDIFNNNNARHPDGARARQTTAEELLDIAAQKIQTDVSQDPEVQIELISTIGELTVQLDKREEGEQLVRARIKLITERFGPDDARLAEALLDLSGVLRQRDKAADALANIDQAIAILDRTGQGSSMLRGRAELEAAHTQTLGSLGTPADRLKRYQNAVDLLAAYPESESYEKAVLGLGRAFEMTRRFDECIATTKRAIELALAAKGENHGETLGNAYQMLSRAYAEQQRYADAAASNAKAIEIYTFMLGPKHEATLSARMDMANQLNLQGRNREAARELEEVVARLIEIDGEAQSGVQSGRLLLATATVAIGDWDRAKVVLDAAIQVIGKMQYQGTLPGLLRLRAKIALEENRLNDAWSDIERAREFAEQRHSRPMVVALIASVRGEILVALNRVDEGRQSLEQAAQLLKEAESDPAQPNGLTVRLGVATADLRQRHFDDARNNANAVLENVSGQARRKELWTIEETALRTLADTRIAEKNFAEACKSIASSVALRMDNALPTDPRLIRSRELQKKYCRI